LGLETCDEGNFWVSELVPGATLAEIQSASKQSSTVMPMGFALAALNDAAKGLGPIHSHPRSFSGPRSSAYGLLRLQNVVVNFQGKGILLNPQFLRWKGEPSVELEPLSGNVGYLSPEAVRGERLDPRSDVFSLAVLMYEFMTNQQLFRGRTPKERANATLRGEIHPPSRLNLSLNPRIDEVLLKALKLEPAGRYPNAAEFSKALSQAAGEYMWRESQRAQLMEKLFSQRSKHLSALTGTVLREKESSVKERAANAARLAEEKRLADERAAQAAAEEKSRAEAARRATAQAATKTGAHATVTTGSSKAVSAQVPGSSASPMRFILPGVALLLVLGVGVAVGLWVNKPAPPPPAPAPVAPVVAAPILDASVELADAGDLSVDGGVSADLDGGTPADSTKKRRKRKEPPLPPWLR
jgi:hypothetical protein